MPDRFRLRYLPAAQDDLPRTANLSEEDSRWILIDFIEKQTKVGGRAHEVAAYRAARTLLLNAVDKYSTE